MFKSYTKSEFLQLGLDVQCEIIEALLTDEYFRGQVEIDAESNSGFAGTMGYLSFKKHQEIKIIEHEKLDELIQHLTEKLFEFTEQIEFGFSSH